MKNRFNKAMNSVYPSDEQKERMFENALSQAESDSEHKKKRKSIRIIISGILIAAAMTSTTVFAEEIKNVFHNFFNDDKTISDNIIDNIYEDSDEHIIFKINRIVSDRINTYAIVEYTALDELGKEWLYGGFEPFVREYTDDKGETKVVMSDIKITPNAFISYSFGVGDKEYTEASDENTRIFRISCKSSDEAPDSENVIINYPMPSDKNCSAQLNVSESVKLRRIEFADYEAHSKSYIPMGVKYSSLGLMIYADDNGYSELSSEEQSKVRSLMTVRILLKNGGYITFDNYMSFDSLGDASYEYDYSLFSTYFKEPIDPDAIAGVMIDDVFYAF